MAGIAAHGGLAVEKKVVKVERHASPSTEYWEQQIPHQAVKWVGISLGFDARQNLPRR
jgi:hypothetical protein